MNFLETHRSYFVISLNKRTPNFDYRRLTKAIATRDHSYKLLMWISDAIDKSLILPSQASHHSGGPDAATEWLRSNYYNIPEDLRPTQSEIDEFAAFFSTYLTSSFDVVEKPGTKGEGPTPSWCRCELCMRIVNAPHLQTKKLCANDKRRADFLMSECVGKLAKENQLDIDDKQTTQLVTGKTTRRHAAYIAYGHWLVRRLSGESDGPAVLALWRIVAWDPRGGMRRGFTLQLNDFKVAEKELLAAIRIAK
ncbi:hypothetical protein ACFL2H_13630 [Planctomycetota bacterium]